MSLLSDLFIPILPSPDYRRLVWVLTGVSGACLIYAQLPLWLSIGLGLSLIWPLSSCACPHVDLQSLAFYQNKWVLNCQDKQEEYKQLQIAVDTGFFLLCRFSDVELKKKRWLVIFYDQLTKDQRRSLHIIETMRNKEVD